MSVFTGVEQYMLQETVGNWYVLPRAETHKSVLWLGFVKCSLF